MTSKFTILLFLLCGFTICAQVYAKLDTSIIHQKDTVGLILYDEDATFPGGLKRLSSFILDNFINKLSLSTTEAQAFRTPMAILYIDEKGIVTDAKIQRSSNVSKLDNEFIKVLKKLPQWTPAKLQGKQVKSEFHIPLRIHFK